MYGVVERFGFRVYDWQTVGFSIYRFCRGGRNDRDYMEIIGMTLIIMPYARSISGRGGGGV